MDFQLTFLLLLLFSLYGLMFFIKKQWSVPYNQAPFITICFIMGLLYIASLLHFLLEITWAIYLFGLVFFGWEVYQKYKQKKLDKKSLKKEKFYPLYVFGILFFINWISFSGHGLNFSDVWHFWGFRIKQLLYFQDLLGGKPYTKK